MSQADQTHQESSVRDQILGNEGLIGLRVISEMHALRCIVFQRAHQVLVDLFYDERCKGSQQSDESGQTLVERQMGSFFIFIVLAFPESATRAAHVPVGQILHELFYRPRRLCG